MPFVKDARPFIRQAFEERFAVVSFNVAGLEMVRGCIMAAQEENAPVMLQTSPGELKNGTPEVFCRMVQALAADVDVPVMMHLDHGDSMERIARCIRAGYSSVMYDGESLPIDDNLAATRGVASFAHGAGMCVEAAAGSFGGGEGGGADVNLTDPAEARRLCAEGDADMVACSVGSQHGQASRLDLQRLESISRLGNVPIVLHGGSGIDHGDLQTAVTMGVVKVNIGTVLSRTVVQVWRAALETENGHKGINVRIADAIRDVAREKIRVTNSANKA